MKNIHLIPTDKPSRVSILNTGKLNFGAKIMSSSNSKAQHIYITSDGWIQEGVYQWYLDKVLNEPYNSGGAQYGEKQDVIILTTDQDLIADGVQDIDDTFLEWFVKNPSCKEVEVKEEDYSQKCRECGEPVKRGYSCNRGCFMKSGNFIPTDKNVKYKTIIPKEEPKQSTVGKEFYESADEIITVYKQDIIQLIEDRILSEYKKHSASLPNEWAKIAAHKIYKSISDKMEEPKQHVEFINSNIEEFDEEQFKQASEYYAHNHFNMHETNNYKALKQGFKAGAKWQVERMYSEEEVQVKLYECLGHFAQKHNIIINGNEIDQWFNQFKKK
jgi:hypothetical protein